MLVQKEARIETPLLKLRQEELHLAIYINNVETLEEYVAKLSVCVSSIVSAALSKNTVCVPGTWPHLVEETCNCSGDGREWNASVTMEVLRGFPAITRRAISSAVPEGLSAF